MKVLDVIIKNEMNYEGHCKACKLQWVHRMQDDCDFGCIVNNDNDMIGKKECLYPNWLKQIVKERHYKKEEQYWTKELKKILDEEKEREQNDITRDS